MSWFVWRVHAIFSATICKQIVQSWLSTMNFVMTTWDHLWLIKRCPCMISPIYLSQILPNHDLEAASQNPKAWEELADIWTMFFWQTMSCAMSSAIADLWGFITETTANTREAVYTHSVLITIHVKMTHKCVSFVSPWTWHLRQSNGDMCNSCAQLHEWWQYGTVSYPSKSVITSAHWRPLDYAILLQYLCYKGNQ